MRLKEEDLKKMLEEELEALLSEEEKNNPWAICTASVGRENKSKYERCVLKVKRKDTKKRRK